MEAEHTLARVIADLIEDDGMQVANTMGHSGLPDTRSFEDAGVMTNNAGLVVRLPDGSEFQVTIVQSRDAY